MPAIDNNSLTSNARSEVKLLVCCARTRIDAERADRIRALVQAGLDWTYLFRMAHRHGLLPLLYHHLKASCLNDVPEQQFAILRDYFYRNAAHNLYLTEELSRVLKLFERHSIPAIPYKGPALSVSIYGHIALRQFADLDLLVHKRDVLRAGEILESQNYSPEVQLTTAQKAAYLRSKNEYNFLSKDRKSLVELHWNFAAEYLSLSLDPERFWKRLESVSLNGMKISTFSPEDLLLILCIHSTKHLWGKISWLCDIAELIKARQDMNWEMVLREATVSGTRRMLFLGLLLANELLEIELPAKLMRLIRDDRAVKALALQAQEKWFRDDAGEPSPWETIYFYLKSIESYRDRMRYCLRLALTPVWEDWSYVRLPDNLYAFYYLVRPYRLFVKYSLRPLARLRRHDIK